MSPLERVFLLGFIGDSDNRLGGITIVFPLKVHVELGFTLCINLIQYLALNDPNQIIKITVFSDVSNDATTP